MDAVPVRSGPKPASVLATVVRWGRPESRISQALQETASASVIARVTPSGPYRLYSRSPHRSRNGAKSYPRFRLRTLVLFLTYMCMVTEDVPARLRFVCGEAPKDGASLSLSAHTDAGGRTREAYKKEGVRGRSCLTFKRPLHKPDSDLGIMGTSSWAAALFAASSLVVAQSSSSANGADGLSVTGGQITPSPTVATATVRGHWQKQRRATGSLLTVLPRSRSMAPLQHTASRLPSRHQQMSAPTSCPTSKVRVPWRRRSSNMVADLAHLIQIQRQSRHRPFAQVIRHKT